ncbi:MAG: YkgJ family cysteine cluster protein [Methanobacterium sp. ERen5]|nr:MAG: YkgJ family cysteine cluster protein [Methanobacterium sp. ERen5]
MLLEELHDRDYIDSLFKQYQELADEQPNLNSELFIFEKMVSKKVKKFLKKSNRLKDVEKKDLKEIVHFSSIVFTEGSLVAALRLDLCNRCGWCCENCSPIYITAEEYESYQKSENIMAGEMVPHEDGYRFEEDRPCEHFIRSTKKCDIYNERPAVCKAYPIMIRDEKYVFTPNHFCKYAVEFVVQKAITEVTTCLKIRDDPEFLEKLKKQMETQIPDDADNLDERVKKWNKIAEELNDL